MNRVRREISMDLSGERSDTTSEREEGGPEMFRMWISRHPKGPPPKRGVLETVHDLSSYPKCDAARRGLERCPATEAPCASVAARVRGLSDGAPEAVADVELDRRGARTRVAERR